MNDHDQPATKKLPKIKVNKIVTSKPFRWLLILIALAIMLYLAYHQGEKHASKSLSTNTNSSNSRRSSDQRLPHPAGNRLTTIGKVEAISADSISVISSHGDKKTGTITKDTKITDRKLKSLKVTDIKTGQRVIIQGTISDKDKLTVTRIRVRD